MTHKAHPPSNDKKTSADLNDIFGPAKEEVQSDWSVEQPVSSEPFTETASPPTLEAMQLKQQIADLQDKVKQKEEVAIRALADAENMRRRCEREVSQARKLGLEKFIGQLLPVFDSLDCALNTMSAEDEKTKAAYEGIQLTLKILLDAFEKNSVVQLNPQGEVFNPDFHEAMSMQEHPDFEPGTVITVFQKGFQLHDRLVRPAKVVVAKANAAKIDERA